MGRIEKERKRTGIVKEEKAGDANEIVNEGIIRKRWSSAIT